MFLKLQNINVSINPTRPHEVDVCQVAGRSDFYVFYGIFI